MRSVASCLATLGTLCILMPSLPAFAKDGASKPWGVEAPLPPPIYAFRVPLLASPFDGPTASLGEVSKEEEGMLSDRRNGIPLVVAWDGVIFDPLCSLYFFEAERSSATGN